MRCQIYNRNTKNQQEPTLQKFSAKDLYGKCESWINRGYCVIFYTLKNNGLKKVKKIFHDCSPKETYNSLTTHGAYIDVTGKEILMADALNEDSFVGDTSEEELTHDISEDINSNQAIPITSKKNIIHHRKVKTFVAGKFLPECQCAIAKHIKNGGR